MELDEKIKKFFPNLCVNKSWALSKEVSRLPRYIAEYLILKFTEGDSLNYEKLQNWIKQYYPLPEEKNKILYQIQKKGFYWLADEFKVEVRHHGKGIIRKNAHISILQIYNADIRDEILEDYEELLRFGCWGLGKVELNNKVYFLAPGIVSKFSEDDTPTLQLHQLKKIEGSFQFKNVEEKRSALEVARKLFEEIYEKKIELWSKEGEIIPILLTEPLEERDREELSRKLKSNGIALYVIPFIKIKTEPMCGPSLVSKAQIFSAKEKSWLESKEKIVLWDNISLLLQGDIEVKRDLEGEINEFFNSLYSYIGSLLGLEITDFKPFQIYSLGVERFIQSRKEFSTEEWKALIMNSIGINPKAYNPKQTLYILARLLPLVENNFNLLELGPKATGKTYIYRNASLYTRIFAGGKISPAALFYHGTYKTIGEIGVRDCIIFDELSKMYFPEEVISKLKDYMVDGFFERLGFKRGFSPCSLVFIDNIELTDTEEILTAHILPSILKDTAFIDRIHAFIDGRKVPKILKSEVSLSKNWGLASDYLSEVFHYLKNNLNYNEFIENSIKLKGELTIRDEKGIKKTISGLLKILYPCLNSESFKISKEELTEIVEVAIELRQNVRKILYRLEPIEFPWTEIHYEIKV